MEAKNKNTQQFTQFLLTIWPILIVILMVAGLYFQTLVPMINVWIINETYTHGFIIVPIFIWLLWQQRAELALQTARPDFRFYPALIMALLVWMLAQLMGVQALAQAGMVGAMIAAIWFVLGAHLARLTLFPVVFLIFLVPVGDFLIEPMMEFTADFTVGMLKLTGIPVYREGMFFTIPTGNWSVVEACSGVRYIIASLVLGVLFAFLNYRSLTKQILLIVASLLIPILANGLRAYMIVMIGHLSNMELATGVDHLVYGWVFFGVVMLILFAVGSIWRDDMTPPEVPEGFTSRTFADRGRTYRSLGWVLVTLALPVLYVNSQYQQVVTSDEAFVSGLQAGQWSACGDAQVKGWQPGISGASAVTRERYCSPAGEVSLFVAWYPYQQQGHEAVNYSNRLNPKEGEDLTASKIQQSDIVTQTIAGSSYSLEQAVVVRDGISYRVWRWYRIGSYNLGDPIRAKAYEAIGKLLHGRGDAMMIVLSAPMASTQETAQVDQRFQDYADAIMPLVFAEADRRLTE